MLSLVIGLSEMRIHTSIELLHLGLQRLLKVGLTLPVSQLNHPYKHKQGTFDPATNLLPQIGVRLKRPCCGRYMACEV